MRTTDSTYTQELQTAVDAVALASLLCRDVRSEFGEAGILDKEDRSPVTTADFGSQAIICSKLAESFPGDPVVAEETSEQLRKPESAELTAMVCRHVRDRLPGLSDDDVLDAIDHGNAPGGPSGRFWTCDPIDGTKGFIRGDQYAVALGLIEDGKVVLGVMGCPNFPYPSLADARGKGTLLVGIVGHEAWWRPIDGRETTAIAVSPTADPADAVMCESVESAHTAHGRSARVKAALGITRPSARIDSQCKYAVVARGDADIYLRLPTRPGYQEKIWDHAAGWAVITAAGGRVTDTNGQPLAFSRGRTLSANRGVVATNGPCHDAVLAALTEQSAPSS